MTTGQIVNEFIKSHPTALLLVVGVLMLFNGFGLGYLIHDESKKVSRLSYQVAHLESDLRSTEAELENEESERAVHRQKAER